MVLLIERGLVTGFLNEVEAGYLYIIFSPADGNLYLVALEVGVGTVVLYKLGRMLLHEQTSETRPNHPHVFVRSSFHLFSFPIYQSTVLKILRIPHSQ